MIVWNQSVELCDSWFIWSVAIFGIINFMWNFEYGFVYQLYEIVDFYYYRIFKLDNLKLEFQNFHLKTYRCDTRMKLY